MLPGEWKEGHDYRMQELVRLLCQRCKRTWGLKDGVDSGVSARKGVRSEWEQTRNVQDSTKVLRKRPLTSSSEEVGDLSAFQKDPEQKNWWQ